jgi:hypothetical protein
MAYYPIPSALNMAYQPSDQRSGYSDPASLQMQVLVNKTKAFGAKYLENSAKLEQFQKDLTEANQRNQFLTDKLKAAEVGTKKGICCLGFCVTMGSTSCGVAAASIAAAEEISALGIVAFGGGFSLLGGLFCSGIAACCCSKI